jgi:hypothetical protein
LYEETVVVTVGGSVMGNQVDIVIDLLLDTELVEIWGSTSTQVWASLKEKLHKSCKQWISLKLRKEMAMPSSGDCFMAIHHRPTMDDQLQDGNSTTSVPAHPIVHVMMRRPGNGFENLVAN